MLRQSLLGVGAVCIAIGACGGTKPPASSPPPAASVRQEVTKKGLPPTATLPVTSATEKSTQPYAEILGIRPALDDPADRRAQIEIFNPTSADCRIESYALTWGNWTKRMPLSKLTLSPGNSRQRFLRIHPSDGNVDDLSADSASVQLEFKCE